MMSGNQLIIDSPVNDDVFASGGEITINAPIASAILLGANVIVNAPIARDLFVAGGAITVNSNIGGKIVAAGGTIDLKGSASNAVLTGGNIVIEESAVIQKDAIISGNTVVNKGKILGNLTVRAQTFENTGTAGNVDYQKTGGMQGFRQAVGGVQLIMFVGFLLLGIILLKLFPREFRKVDAEIREHSAKKTIVGFLLMVFSAIVLLMLMITIIGIPVAIVAFVVYLVALLLSPLFVSYSIGRMLAGPSSTAGDTWLFVAGFILMNLVMIIPIIGGLIWLIALSLGFGAMYYALLSRQKETVTQKKLK